MDSKSVMDYGNGWVNNIISASAAVVRFTHIVQTPICKYPLTTETCQYLQCSTSYRANRYGQA